eukprot:361700-Chlamydomonas_euryale.AAC.6
MDPRQAAGPQALLCSGQVQAVSRLGQAFPPTNRNMGLLGTGSSKGWRGRPVAWSGVGGRLHGVAWEAGCMGWRGRPVAWGGVGGRLHGVAWEAGCMEWRGRPVAAHCEGFGRVGHCFFRHPLWGSQEEGKC